MKLTATQFAKFESKGKPEFTTVIHGTISHIILEYAKWIQTVYMGSHIKMTIARTELELEHHTNPRVAGSGADEDMMAELAGILSQDQLPLAGE